MDIQKYLLSAGVPDNLHEQALASLEEAHNRADGLLMHKIKARYFKSKQMAEIVHSHKVTRASVIRADLVHYDVAPMLNINAFGDNADWDSITGLPEDENVYVYVEGAPEYDAAVRRNYWAKGLFPGDLKAVQAWYRRNGGEYRAWELGMPVNVKNSVAWHGDGVTVYSCDGAWQVTAKDKRLGIIPVKVRIGYEISNIWRESDGAQLWYPLPGFDLRAPVTWSILPGK